MTATQLGRVQLLIMQVLWDKGRASAREITDALNEREPIAHSTVRPRHAKYAESLISSSFRSTPPLTGEVCLVSCFLAGRHS